MAKAQETEDAELVALAALVHRESVEFEAASRQYGEMPWDPRTPAKIELESMLKLRGVLPNG